MDDESSIDVQTAIILLKNLSVRAATRAVATRDVDAAAVWFMTEAAPLCERVDPTIIPPEEP